MNVQAALLDVPRMGEADRLTVASGTPAPEPTENGYCASTGASPQNPGDGRFLVPPVCGSGCAAEQALPPCRPADARDVQRAGQRGLQFLVAAKAWTTYPAGLLSGGFGALYGELQKRGNPPWGGVEANAGIAGGALDWETYLGWHYNHGAVLVAINTGATGQELPDLLEKSAFGQEALAAYHKFLAGVPLREKPVTDTPQLRVQRKMVAVQAGFRAWQAAGRDPGPIGHYVEEKIGPLLQAGKLSEAETVLEEALRRLAAPTSPSAATTGK